MDPYDRMILAGPPEPPTEDVTVEYEVYAREGQLSAVIEHLGGEAHWARSTIEGGYRLVKGSTLIEEAEGYEEAEDIVHNLMSEHLRHFVDLDNAVITAERIEPDEPDWDAIDKDRRIERMYAE